VQPKSEVETRIAPWNDFCRSVLRVIAEQSPCPESMLLIVAANQGLGRFGDGTLSKLQELLHQCTQELQARGFVNTNKQHLVISPAGKAEDEDTTTVAAKPEDGDVAELTVLPGEPEDTDILDLTCPPELSPPRPTNREASTAQTQLPTRHPTKPTRGKLIASMRRFISNDWLRMVSQRGERDAAWSSHFIRRALLGRSLSDVARDASILVHGEHVGYVRVGPGLAAADVGEGLAVSVDDFVATWDLLNGPWRREPGIFVQ
jgi:hypothetical protein